MVCLRLGRKSIHVTIEDGSQGGATDDENEALPSSATANFSHSKMLGRLHYILVGMGRNGI